MLTVVLPEKEYFNDETSEFVTLPSVTLELEHSLVSLSKWESKWEIPFLGNKPKTEEQTLDYIRAMTLTPGVPDDVYTHERLGDENISLINDYITAKMTATWFAEKPGQGKPTTKVTTAELIYFYMVQANVPVEFQHWHLNRLLTLLRVISQETNPGKKLSKAELAQRNRELNAQRRAQMGSRG